MELYFGGAAERFRRLHMIESVMFLPYGCAVDEFQHFVYAEPDCGPAARKLEWRALERKYLCYFRHHAVPGNRGAINVFRHGVFRMWWRTLNRRSQTGRFSR
jgi:hypothetical protein